MRAPRKAAATLASISLLLLASCASTKEAVLPQGGPSMKGIYEAHMEALRLESPEVVRGALGSRRPQSGEAALSGFTREAHDELEVIFPRLPNPTLVLYVFPHLAGAERVPVPGYVTTFPMYERVEYALPGEVSAGSGRFWTAP